MNKPVSVPERRCVSVLRVTGFLTQVADPEIDAICRRAKDEFGVERALVKLVDLDRVQMEARVGFDALEVPRPEAFSDITIEGTDVFVVPDARKDPRFVASPLVTLGDRIRFYAGAPLIYLRDVTLASLRIFDSRPRQFSLGDRAELMSLAEELVSMVVRQDFKRVSRLLDR